MLNQGNQARDPAGARVAAGIVATIVALAAGPVLGQPGGAPAAAEAAPAAVAPVECFPACRAGFLCHQGRCVSACNPPCGPGQVCSPEGACLSACNPPCGPGQACSDAGQCTAVSNPAAAVGAGYQPAAPSAAAADPYREASSNFHMNALGLIQFGVQPTLEFGGETTFLGRLRVLNLGLLPYVLAAAEDESFLWGFGLCAAVRRYMGGDGNQRGAYFGGGLEYIASATEDDYGKYSTKLLVPQFDIGYRWVKGKYFLGVGASLGFAFTVAANYPDTENTVYGNLALDLGTFF